MPVSDNDSRYRTCCCHVRTCALIIAVLEVLGLLSTMIGALQGKMAVAGVYHTSIAGFVAMLIVVPILIYGVLKEQPLALIPHIIVQVLTIIGCIIGGIVFIVLGALVKVDEESQSKQEEARMVRTLLIGMGVGFLIGGLIEIYFTYVIVRCYKYLKEKTST